MRRIEFHATLAVLKVSSCGQTALKHCTLRAPKPRSLLDYGFKFLNTHKEHFVSRVMFAELVTY